MKLSLVAVVAVGAAVFSVIRSASADTFPTQPVRIVVPYAPGGSTDILARVIGEEISPKLGQPVVVENRPGAGGGIGTEIVAKSAPDGHTLVMATNGTHAINISLFEKLAYHPIKDFAPITIVASVPLVLVVPASLPVASVPELISFAANKPHMINFGSAGLGSSGHLAGEMLRTMGGFQATHVPYKGDAPALAELVAGQLTFQFANMPAAVGQIRAGALRPLAVSTAEPSPAMPEVPTMQGAGIQGFEVNPWYGLLAPAGTPAAVVQRLHREVIAALKSPKVMDKMVPLGAQPVGNSPDEFAAVIAAEIPKYAKVIKDSGARVE